MVTLFTWKLHQRLCDTVTVTIYDVQLVALTIAKAINSHMPALQFVSSQSFPIILKTRGELPFPHTTITLNTLLPHHNLWLQNSCFVPSSILSHHTSLPHLRSVIILEKINAERVLCNYQNWRWSWSMKRFKLSTTSLWVSEPNLHSLPCVSVSILIQRQTCIVDTQYVTAAQILPLAWPLSV